MEVKLSVSRGFATSSPTPPSSTLNPPPPLNCTSDSPYPPRTNPPIGITSTLMLLVAPKITRSCSLRRNGSSHAPHCTNQSSPLVWWLWGPAIRAVRCNPVEIQVRMERKFRSCCRYHDALRCYRYRRLERHRVYTAIYNVLGTPPSRQAASPPGMTTPHVYQHPVPIQTHWAFPFFLGAKVAGPADQPA